MSRRFWQLAALLAAMPLMAAAPDAQAPAGRQTHAPRTARTASASATISLGVQPFAVATLATPQVSLTLNGGMAVSELQSGLGECLTNHDVVLSLQGGRLERLDGGPALSWGSTTTTGDIGHWEARLKPTTGHAAATMAVAGGTRTALDVELVAHLDSQHWKQAYAGAYVGTIVLSVQPAP